MKNSLVILLLLANVMAIPPTLTCSRYENIDDCTNWCACTWNNQTGCDFGDNSNCKENSSVRIAAYITVFILFSLCVFVCITFTISRIYKATQRCKSEYEEIGDYEHYSL